MFKKIIFIVFIASTIFVSQSLAGITVYSGQHKQGVAAVAKAFAKDTGIKVNIKNGSSSQLSGLISEEGKKSPADVFWAEQIPPLLALSHKNLLGKLNKKALNSPGYDNIPKAPKGDWVATSARARVVVYNPNLISKKDLAQSILDYPTKKWQGRIGYVATSGAFLEQVIGITKLKSSKVALNWLKGLKKYGVLFPHNRTAMMAVERGRVAAALINHYYWYSMVKERGGKKNVTSRLDYIGHKDPGAMLTYAAIGMLKNSDNNKEAMKFVDYVTSKKGQQIFCDIRAEYPVRSDVHSAFNLKPYSELDPPIISPTTFNDRQDALKLLEKAGLK